MDRGRERVLLTGILIGAIGMLALVAVGLVVALVIGSAITRADDEEREQREQADRDGGQPPLLGVVRPPGA